MSFRGGIGIGGGWSIRLGFGMMLCMEGMVMVLDLGFSGELGRREIKCRPGGMLPRRLGGLETIGWDWVCGWRAVVPRCRSFCRILRRASV